MNYNPEIHHRKSYRMPGWDYARGGKYYVTICTRNKICCFGDVVNDEMRLNEMGKIVHKYWLEIPECFPNTFLNAFQIMPNHIHCIVIMKRLPDETNGKPNVWMGTDNRNAGTRPEQLEGRDEIRTTGMHERYRNNLNVWSRPYIPLNIPSNILSTISKTEQMSGISPKPGSLSVIIGGWKSKCTKEFKKLGHGGWFAWQPRFHDEIIRNDAHLQQICAYICNNPKNWNSDDKNPKNSNP